MRLVQELIGTTWTDRNQGERPMTPADVLVVTPFNAQVREIDNALADAGIAGVRVGTVDKFQGQEAPAVVYSMASSTSADAPRGLEFLFDLHRLNVATSVPERWSCSWRAPIFFGCSAGPPARWFLLMRSAERGSHDTGARRVFRVKWEGKVPEQGYSTAGSGPAKCRS